MFLESVPAAFPEPFVTTTINKMNEQELAAQLQETEKELHQAKLVLAEAKRRCTDAETQVIDLKIHRDRIKEKLRVCCARTPQPEDVRRDEVIEQFRKDHPELVEMAKQRDLDRGK